jgi:hypothetical protein
MNFHVKNSADSTLLDRFLEDTKPGIKTKMESYQDPDLPVLNLVNQLVGTFQLIGYGLFEQDVTTGFSSRPSTEQMEGGRIRNHHRIRPIL